MFKESARANMYESVDQKIKVGGVRKR